MIRQKKEPSINTPLHWMVQKARDDVNSVLYIEDEKLVSRLSNLISTEKKPPEGTIDQIKEVLKTLRQDKTIVIKDKGVLSVGLSLKEIKERLDKLLGG